MFYVLGFNKSQARGNFNYSGDDTYMGSANVVNITIKFSLHLGIQKQSKVKGK